MDWHTLLDIELPVFTAFLLGGIGYLIRETIKNRDEQRRAYEGMRDQLRSLIDKFAVRQEVLLDMRRDVDSLKRTVPQLSENLAVLTAEFQNHEEWHERTRRIN